MTPRTIRPAEPPSTAYDVPSRTQVGWRRPHERVARWSAEHPWRAIGGWLLLVVVATALAAVVPTRSTEAADYRIGESGRAAELVEQAGLAPPPSESILIEAAGGSADVDRAEATAAATELTRGLTGGVTGVVGVAEPVWNPDGTALLLDVELRDGTDDVSAIQEVTRAVADEHPGLSLRQTGDVSLDAGIDARVAEDLSSAEVISLPVTLVLMLLAFGALIAAGVPVLLAATSVAATIGVAAPLSHLVPAEPTAASMIVLIGMAVGVDYSLFYLKREREERARGRTTLDAVEIAARTSGHSILVSGAAVVASMAGLYVVGSATFDSLATAAIAVVAIAVVGSTTVLPALLVTLGRWVDRPRLPLLWRLGARIGRGGISRRVLAPVLRHPVAALAGSGVLAVALAAPSLGLTLHGANLQTLPADIPEVATMHRISSAFPAQGAAVEVVVRARPDRSGEVAGALATLQRRAVATRDFVGSGPGATTVSADGSTTVLRLAMPYDEADPAVDAAVERLRSSLAPDALSALEAPGAGEVEYAVGGGPAESLDFADRQAQRMPLVIGLVLLLTLVMMAVAFRSLPIALVSSLLNLLSVGIAFGILRLVFQEGWLSGPLVFTSPGFVVDWIPLFVLVVLVGLSMDYHVFVLSRVREHVAAGLPMRLAVARGIADTAGVVTSAAAVMVSVFAIFATLSMLEMKSIGVGLAAAILVDATLIRLVMLPAALVLLGDRAWWPRPALAPRGEPVSETDSAWRLADESVAGPRR